MPGLSDPAARLLARVMSALSEEYFCAQWPDGNEYRLWADLTGEKVCGRRGFGITAEEQAELRLAHEVASGWIVWSEEDKGLKLVPAADWLKHISAGGIVPTA